MLLYKTNSDLKLHCIHNINESGTVGGDVCGLNLQPDYIEMTCSINYRGNVAPTLLWDEIIDNHNITNDVIKKADNNKLAISTAVIQAGEDMNGLQFNSSVTMKWNISSRAVQLNITWSSPAIIILCT